MNPFLLLASLGVKYFSNKSRYLLTVGGEARFSPLP